ncbi:hypothetical protein K443DRAFT_475324 [Laccaria amethystina LaAM-08-1]|uniref:Uncharacterized protein n=1 Tax=Laccaria amethystina LaAM-08-1 TaxID=1095629 RepID=A0A0C9X1Y3_9AGAR|nr:hypothetical protein K443DRAFT_475324 [Laccaria amethystina LaAM-08-1]
MSPIYNFFCRLRRSTAEILGKSRQPWGVAETKISAGPSRVTGPAELIEMAQYPLFSVRHQREECFPLFFFFSRPSHLLPPAAFSAVDVGVALPTFLFFFSPTTLVRIALPPQMASLRRLCSSKRLGRCQRAPFWFHGRLRRLLVVLDLALG